MKKRILGIFLLMAGVVTLTSCYDDNDSLTGDANLSVSKAEIIFQPGGGTGTVTVRSATAYTVTSEQDWCTVSTSGNTITVETPEYAALESRYSKLTIKAGTEETTVTVHQYGLIFAVYDGPAENRLVKRNAAFTNSYSMKTNADLTITSSASWLKGVITEDADGNQTLTITGEENTTGKYRKGTLTYSFNELEGEIDVIQGEPEYLLGSFQMYGYNPAGTQVVGFEGELTDDDNDAGSGYTLYLTVTSTIEWALPVFIDEENLTIGVKAGLYLGKYGNYDVRSCLWDLDAGNLTWLTTAGMSSAFDYDEDYDSMYAILDDDGTWGTYNANCFRFEAYTAGGSANSGRQGYLSAIQYPIMETISEDEEGEEIQALAVPRLLKRQKQNKLKINAQ